MNIPIFFVIYTWENSKICMKLYQVVLSNPDTTCFELYSSCFGQIISFYE